MWRSWVWLAAAMLIRVNCALAEEGATERLDALEKRVQTLEGIILHASNPDAITGVPGRTEQRGNDSLLKLANWSAGFNDCGYGTHCYAVAYTLLNGYDKP
jgi:hypothetical protein